jgi:hypothetical protein
VLSSDGEGTRARARHSLSVDAPQRIPAVLLLEDLGVLGAWELFPFRDLHHIGVDLEAIAIGIEEVK